MKKYKIVESLKHKAFLAFPIKGDFIDYGTVVFNNFKEAKEKAKELTKQKYQ